MNKIKHILCILVGHSRIQTCCCYEWSCNRCGTVVGEALTGTYNRKGVYTGNCDCKECKVLFKSLTWKDKLLVPKSSYKVHS